MKAYYLSIAELSRDLVSEYGYSGTATHKVLSRHPFPTKKFEIFIKTPAGIVSFGMVDVFMTPEDIEAHFNMRTKGKKKKSDGVQNKSRRGGQLG